MKMCTCTTSSTSLAVRQTWFDSMYDEYSVVVLIIHARVDIYAYQNCVIKMLYQARDSETYLQRNLKTMYTNT